MKRQRGSLSSPQDHSSHFQTVMKHECMPTHLPQWHVLPVVSLSMAPVAPDWMAYIFNTPPQSKNHMLI